MTQALVSALNGSTDRRETKSPTTKAWYPSSTRRSTDYDGVEVPAGLDKAVPAESEDRTLLRRFDLRNAFLVQSANELKGIGVIEWRQADVIRVTAQGQQVAAAVASIWQQQMAVASQQQRVPSYVSTVLEVHWDAGARNEQCPRLCGCGAVDEETGRMRPCRERCVAG